MKSKKGFTLIEILAAITILALLTGIAVVSVTKIIDNAKENHYTTAEENIILAGQNYSQQNREVLPKSLGQKTKLPLSLLIEKKYIQEIMDYSNNVCDIDKSYVEIYKYSKNDYTYQVYLECPSYTSENRIKANTPSITASINIDAVKSTPKANITIIGNDKIMSYNYIIYRNNKEVKNTGNISVTDNKERLVLNLNLKDYTPGKIKMQITATNTYGNVKTITISEDVKDQKGPTCIIKEEDKTTSPKEWTKENRKIVVGCEDGDGSGCVKKEISKTFKTTTKDGIIVIEDKDGNKTNCNVSVYIDKTPPTCSVSGGNTTWINNSSSPKSRTITATCSDEDSGCATAPFSKTYSENINTKKAGAVDEQQGGIVYDKAGNSTVCSADQTVKIDLTNPTCTNSGDSTDWTRENRTIKYGCKDDESGCNTSYSGSSVIQSTTAKTKTIAAYTIKDKAGNTTNCSERTANVYVDKTGPTCTNSGDSTTWTKENRTISYGCDDSDSGCDPANSGSSTIITTTAKTKVIAKYKIKDAVGNETTCPARTANVYVDKTGPTCTNSGDSTTWTSGNRTIYYGCSDSYSGCNSNYSGSSKTFSSTTKTSTIESYKIKDAVGNETTCPARTANVYVDKTAPYVQSVSLADLKVTQWDSDGNEISGAYVKSTSCTSPETCTAVVCIKNKKGSFQVSGFSPTYADADSGYRTSYFESNIMYDKNDVPTGGGCLKTKGHNPCFYKWTYSIYDKVYNYTYYTITYKVGYIDQGDGSGC